MGIMAQIKSSNYTKYNSITEKDIKSAIEEIFYERGLAKEKVLTKKHIKRDLPWKKE
tara:strand:+ start:1644 stop:1814 length:171 start_codon:yes stop_codon:yes gene_type:complete